MKDHRCPCYSWQGNWAHLWLILLEMKYSRLCVSGNPSSSLFKPCAYLPWLEDAGIVLQLCTLDFTDNESPVRHMSLHSRQDTMTLVTRG